MAVPEAAVDEYRRPETGEHHIRAARQVAAVQPEAEAPGVQPAAQDQLRFRVLAANAAHVESALGGREDICHAGLCRRGRR